MSDHGIILQVAVPSPLYQTFDYLPPLDCDAGALRAGVRVRIPFGRTTRIGLLLSVHDHSRVPRTRLRPVSEILDRGPVLPTELLELLGWASRYYHHPLGEVIFNALPSLLRRGTAAVHPPHHQWSLTAQGQDIDPRTLARAPRQQEVLERLRHGPLPETTDRQTRTALASLQRKGWAERVVLAAEHPERARGHQDTHDTAQPTLNPAQLAATSSITQSLDEFHVHLLDGVTGSGKTEVYIHVIEKVIALGRQALLLVPEIALTPQLVERFRQRFREPIAVLHSGLSERDRLDAWLDTAAGTASITIGTRSAIFTPMKRPGVIVIDEEHDPSLKQQDGFRYHARDVAVMRARRLRIPVILGSATPSLESLHNAMDGRYQHLVLATRAGDAAPPRIRLIDISDQRLDHGMAPALLNAMAAHLDKGNQVLLFLNRRGYAPTLLCHHCGWIAVCGRCDAHMVLHQSRGELRCHHCDARRPVDVQCPQCASIDLRPLGQGTERVGEALRSHFPEVEVIRIDRDSTRRRGAMQELLRRVSGGSRQILLGTQMLAKGHHLPNVTLAGILETDQGLFGCDFRAGERMGQLIVQVAGRSGRADKPGEVLIQTRCPDHPLIRTLISHDYAAFAASLMAERRAAHLPPFSNLALVRSEATDRPQPMRFLQAVREVAGTAETGVRLLGPAPAFMERRAGRYRAHLLLEANRRDALHRLVDRLIPEIAALPAARRVRWSIDIDPVDVL